MSIIAEFTVPAEQFALYETLCRATEMVVEVERVVTHGPDRIMPYFWTRDGDRETFETAARNDPSVEDLTKLDELDQAVLYRANWIQDVESVVYAYTETGAILLDATGQNERWELQLRFDSEGDVTQFNNYIDESEFVLDLTRLYHPSHPTTDSHCPLTEVQRETLVAGLKSGYYEIPRETTPSELAEQFGISRQALSKRFRRVHKTLAENEVNASLDGVD
ncbi:HTH DNA binding domain protein [Halalkalicoccus paucihalophilus]|uniref:HTH DNA binding domain protein n=2 Tax=Halalkalicoccus paucihalophilus TaxID=1008153 RepID=A0A151AFQ6_9EURY|nr:HTH DNA binding domain protein [Halalkalicoccus paucihalophilus]